jgi:ribose 5-phosphate isomerase A
MQDVVERQKREAAARALAFVEPGMRLGLGTGTTAKHFVALLGEKVAAGLQVVGVPTSEATRAQAESLSIPLATLDEVPALDITVDGADEVGPDLVLIKGGGGALLREKIVASASARMIVIADASKWVSVLGGFPLPIEVVPFGFSAGCRGRLEIRRTKDGHPFVTDGGHWIVDAALGRITDPTALATRLDGIAGVVDHGLFIGLADTVILAGPDGARLIEKAGRTTPGERE